MTIMFISAGHSDNDPGAVGNGKREADIAVEFRNIVSFYLTQAGRLHQLDGKGTSNLPLRDAVKLASKSRPPRVEFHCNAAANPSATGVEVLCAAKDNKIATRICEALALTLGIRNRGVKPENAGQHHRLVFVQAGGMIVELFFISNAKDLAAYEAKKWLAGKAVAAVLLSA